MKSVAVNLPSPASEEGVPAIPGVPNNEAVAKRRHQQPTRWEATKLHYRGNDVGQLRSAEAASASAAAGLARWCRPMQDHAEVLRVNVKQQQRQTCRSSGVRGRRRSPTERVARSPAFSQAAPAPSAARTSAGVEGSAAGRVASCEDESLMCHAHARERTREANNARRTRG